MEPISFPRDFWHNTIGFVPRDIEADQPRNILAFSIYNYEIELPALNRLAKKLGTKDIKVRGDYEPRKSWWQMWPLWRAMPVTVVEVRNVSVWPSTDYAPMTPEQLQRAADFLNESNAEDKALLEAFKERFGDSKITP
jgi:hypothetical protein